ncbi:hypothetical protein LXL04_018392 [Taraxacum kok-saghyz]
MSSRALFLFTKIIAILTFPTIAAKQGELVKESIAIIRSQIPFGRKSMPEAYADIVFRAWNSAGNQATSSSPVRFRPLHLLRRDSGELISRFSSHSPLLLLRRPFHSPEENSTKPDTSSDDTSDLHRGWNGLRRIGIGNPEETQGDGRARVGRWR